MLFPYVKRSQLLKQSYHFKNTHLKFIMNKQIDVIFVIFLFQGSKMIPISYIIHEYVLHHFQVESITLFDIYTQISSGT